MILLGLFATLLQAKGTVRLDRDARPLLLIEDPETRLHPIMLSVAWHLLNLLPLQRVTTTNSGELLSLTPVEQVCRLVRESTRVSAWRLGPGGMNAEESRRIAFHIRFNRASSLFARCWLLVEGETETWVINELARQCGHHFDAEGVKVIEFAQSGLKPLIKFARRMGIQWHVLVDGDEAGKKYAATVRGLLNNDRELERDHLTSLPALDMEHFMYRQGFDDVYHRVAQIPDNVPMNMRRVITKAIHRSSKPDLAIEVAMEAGRRGVDAVPTLLKKMFPASLWLARGRADYGQSSAKPVDQAIKRHSGGGIRTVFYPQFLPSVCVAWSAAGKVAVILPLSAKGAPEAVIVSQQFSLFFLAIAPAAVDMWVALLTARICSTGKALASVMTASTSRDVLGTVRDRLWSPAECARAGQAPAFRR